MPAGSYRVGRPRYRAHLKSCHRHLFSNTRATARTLDPPLLLERACPAFSAGVGVRSTRDLKCRHPKPWAESGSFFYQRGVFISNHFSGLKTSRHPKLMPAGSYRVGRPRYKAHLKSLYRRLFSNTRATARTLDPPLLLERAGVRSTRDLKCRHPKIRVESGSFLPNGSFYQLSFYPQQLT